MPIYEYRCASCGFEKEYLQKVSDPRLTVCPECGKPTFDKLVSAAGFQLKGSGWYVTDFKGNGSRPSGDKDKAGGDKEKPAETKPAEPKSDGKADAAGAGASTAST